MRFSVNGSDQGIAFRVSKSELAGRPLFPHVLTKNQVPHDDAGDPNHSLQTKKIVSRKRPRMNNFYEYFDYFQDFTVNFGQMPGPLCPLEQGYTPIGQLDFADGIVRFEIVINSVFLNSKFKHSKYLEIIFISKYSQGTRTAFLQSRL